MMLGKRVGSARRGHRHDGPDATIASCEREHRPAAEAVPHGGDTLAVDRRLEVAEASVEEAIEDEPQVGGTIGDPSRHVVCGEGITRGRSSCDLHQVGGRVPGVVGGRHDIAVAREVGAQEGGLAPVAPRAMREEDERKRTAPGRRVSYGVLDQARPGHRPGVAGGINPVEPAIPVLGGV